MNCEYVRQHYGVPAQVGRRVTVYGKPGVIAADRGHYLGVNFDADKPGVIHNAHPTSGVVYGDMGAVRPMTRAQRRYMEYLDVADLYESFAAFLTARSNDQAHASGEAASRGAHCSATPDSNGEQNERN